jgi:hypothetical protein
VELAAFRSHTELYPKKTQFSTSEVSHWLSLPPVPGFNGWGSEPFEIIEEICLQELSPKVQSKHDKAVAEDGSD